MRLLVTTLDTGALSTPGTDLGKGLTTALRVLPEGDSGEQAVVVFTDGEDLEGHVEAAAALAQHRGVKVFPVGVGTPAGETIPVLDDNGHQVGVKTDASGQPVVSRLDGPALEGLAHRTGGRAFTAQHPGGQLAALKAALAGVGRSARQGRLGSRPVEHFVGFALAASDPPRRVVAPARAPRAAHAGSRRVAHGRGVARGRAPRRVARGRAAGGARGAAAGRGQPALRRRRRRGRDPRLPGRAQAAPGRPRAVEQPRRGALPRRPLCRGRGRVRARARARCTGAGPRRVRARRRAVPPGEVPGGARCVPGGAREAARRLRRAPQLRGHAAQARGTAAEPEPAAAIAAAHAAQEPAAGAGRRGRGSAPQPPPPGQPQGGPPPPESPDPGAGHMSKQQAERLLDALDAGERQARAAEKRRQGGEERRGKDW